MTIKILAVLLGIAQVSAAIYPRLYVIRKLSMHTCVTNAT